LIRSRQKDNAKPRSRWIIIGPGIILAIIFALQIAINNHKSASVPPIIEKQVIGGETTQSMTPTPEVGYVLEREDSLGLSSAQESSLRKLQAEWEARSRPLVATMNKAARDFQAFMDKSGGRATMRDIQSHTGYVSESSRQVSSLRRVYWQKALYVLDKRQQSVIEKSLSGALHGSR
jgi:hypothetical protein